MEENPVGKAHTALYIQQITFLKNSSSKAIPPSSNVPPNLLELTLQLPYPQMHSQPVLMLVFKHLTPTFQPHNQV